MLYLRVVKTKSKSRAVQVIRYHDGRRIIVKHIGSARDDDDLQVLTALAHEYISEIGSQADLFPPSEQHSNLLLLNQAQYLGFYYTFLYDLIHSIQIQIGYTESTEGLLTDLVVMRIIEPCSKLRSIELMETYFGIRHRRQRYYESALKWLDLKAIVEQQTLEFAKQKYGFNFSMLFYDVTTLYFETFEADELRKPGFSKDGKSQQPQILVALMVTQDGFPVSYEVFAGNTFEGHTLLPVIQSFIKLHQVQHFTVVADAAMISTANVEALRAARISYIVGARLGNIPDALFEQINTQLPREEGRTIRIETARGFLICSFSKQRYKKDSYEMNKQIEKARGLLSTPSKAQRVKFLRTDQKTATLNEELISKTTALLGVKGYYTDLAESIADNQTVIARYHDLYKVEQAFRVSKSDLKTRPIFHFKEEPIKLHLLICFMALAVSKHIELRTKGSIRALITECKKITDARLQNKITGKELRLRAPIPSDLQRQISKLH